MKGDSQQILLRVLDDIHFEAYLSTAGAGIERDYRQLPKMEIPVPEKQYRCSGTVHVQSSLHKPEIGWEHRFSTPTTHKRRLFRIFRPLIKQARSTHKGHGGFGLSTFLFLFDLCYKKLNNNKLKINCG